MTSNSLDITIEKCKAVAAKMVVDENINVSVLEPSSDINIFSQSAKLISILDSFLLRAIVLSALVVVQQWPTF